MKRALRLTMLHTAQVHCAAFDAVRDEIAPGVELRHIVRPDWLERAKTGINPELSTEITAAISAAIAGATDKVICTCTSIGAVAASAGAIRIDQPMMQAAAASGGPVMLVFCLQSTRAPSMDLLQSAMAAAGNRSKIIPLALPNLWPLFEAGKADDFARAIEGAIRRANTTTAATIVLAQASMAGAAPLLADLGKPVLASPELAFRSALAEI